MNKEEKNKQCQICHGYLFDDDDIVVCPVCGAPHHRDCWNSVGHCGVEQYHGTDLQYDIVQKKNEEAAASQNDGAEEHTCAYCGRTARSDGAEFCPYCGHPYRENGPFGQLPFTGGAAVFIDPLGGVDKDRDIDGVKAGELATFVGSGSQRYLPRFAALDKQHKNSWNWAAFLFPSAWSFSRKMYRSGAFLLILTIAAVLCFVPYQLVMETLVDSSKVTFTQYFNTAMNNLGSFTPISLIMASFGTALNLGIRIFAGIRGDWLYRCYAVEKVKAIKADDTVEDLDDELSHSGSVSIILLFAAILAEAYLPRIILGLISL